MAQIELGTPVQIRPDGKAGAGEVGIVVRAYMVPHGGRSRLAYTVQVNDRRKIETMADRLQTLKPGEGLPSVNRFKA